MAVAAAHEFHWLSLAPLPTGRVYHSLAEVGGQLFVVGGCDETGQPISALELYSPEVDQWVGLPPMPTPRAGAAVAVLGKQLLVLGGVGIDQRPLKSVELYNTEEGRWRKRSALREAAMGISLTVKDGRVFAVGGMGRDLFPRSVLQQYDLRKDMWVSLSPMPTPRYDAAVHLLGTKIYVAGGRQCKRSVKAFEVYDTESRSWAVLPSMPCKRAYSGLVWDREGQLYSLGGLRQGGVHQRPKFTKNVNIFDSQQGVWQKSEETVSLKTKRADFVSAFLQGRVIVAGGLGNQPSMLDSVEAYHPGKRKWEYLPPMTSPRCSASCIVIQDRLLVVGGVNQSPSPAHEVLYVKLGESL
ncbi:kelch domain-containing protein 8A [Lepisosteus oculatus]|uniref:kelch domain-containing protein 8A n=1 Tax=Lepisosteus oculatus TaxID=7918 RepID=UPI0003EAD639|nr:PREDICTED: kelch domain-containing protein 8A [Lepisosteus oculatus]XP_015198300.1 PREDICTED: kelch domain-containing protein 8A [Lepisosteus oculatus]XP_015198301.1 PREDICTED: kelch domain-containing protein 8A [Lepisosteus oculatus]